MERFIKISSLVFSIILAVVSIGLLMLQTLGSIIAFATGVLFIYYLVIYLLCFLAKKVEAKNRQRLIYGLTVLWIIPILWGMIDGEGMIESLLPDFNLDMK